MFILILLCFWITFCTLKHYLSRIFEELAKFDVFITAVNIWLSNAISISRYRSPAVYSTPICTKRSCTVFFKFSSRAINDCLTPIDNRGRLIQLYSFSDSIKLLQRCSHARNSFRVFNWATCTMRSRFVWSILSFWTVARLLTNWALREANLFVLITWKDASFGLLHVLTYLNMFQ